MDKAAIIARSTRLLITTCSDPELGHSIKAMARARLYIRVIKKNGLANQGDVQERSGGKARFNRRFVNVAVQHAPTNHVAIVVVVATNTEVSRSP
jgi:hypothetical protein